MRIEHVAIWTKDLERLKAFYETYFGASVGARYENPRKRFESYFLSFSTGARLELMRRNTAPLSILEPSSQSSSAWAARPITTTRASSSAAVVLVMTALSFFTRLMLLDLLNSRWVGRFVDWSFREPAVGQGGPAAVGHANPLRQD